MIKVKLVDLIFDEYSQMGIMILEVDSSSKDNMHKVLPIWIGIFEAQAILFKLQNMFFPRPLTHDLIKNGFDLLGVKVDYVVISKIQDNTYYAEIHLAKGEEKFVLDSRPSDAVAIAVRTDATIYVAEKVLETSGVLKEEFVKEQKEKLYKQLLELSEISEEKKLKH